VLGVANHVLAMTRMDRIRRRRGKKQRGGAGGNAKGGGYLLTRALKSMRRIRVLRRLLRNYGSIRTCRFGGVGGKNRETKHIIPFKVRDRVKTGGGPKSEMNTGT